MVLRAGTVETTSGCAPCATAEASSAAATARSRMIGFPLGRCLYHAGGLAVKHDLRLLTCLTVAASTVGMSEGVAYSERDGIAEIALDDGKVNAMSMTFFDGLNAALDRAEEGDARAVVVSGRAGYFSAGLNIKLLPTLPPDEMSRTLVTFGRT